jgi:hypothetical protein
MLRCRLRLPNNRASCAIYGMARAAYRYRRGAAMTVLVEPLRPFTTIEAVSALSWRAGGAASRLTPPTITDWGCFRARARPLPRSPRRARGSPNRPPKTSPNGANNDCPRLWYSR